MNESQKFRRWNWIRYAYVTPSDDRRRESQKVVPESLLVSGTLKPPERARLLAQLVRASFADAEARSESLVLLRPAKLELSSILKTNSELASEARKHAQLAAQLSLFDATAKPMKPCPVQFTADWRDEDGNAHRHECDDWETTAAYNRFERRYGRAEAIRIIRHKFEDEFFRAGLVLAFSTHSRRNVTYGARNQWLLVGLIRLNPDPQPDLLTRKTGGR